jgi:hypothetical protein
VAVGTGGRVIDIYMNGCKKQGYPGLHSAQYRASDVSLLRSRNPDQTLLNLAMATLGEIRRLAGGLLRTLGRLSRLWEAFAITETANASAGGGLNLANHFDDAAIFRKSVGTVR